MPCEWNVETLLTHLQALRAADDQRYGQRFDDQKIAVDAALSAAKEAVIKAEMAAEKRFESVNEFRSTLADQQRTLIPRAEFQITVTGMERELAALKTEMDRLHNERLGVISWVGSAAGAIGLLVVIGSLVALALKFAKG